MPAYIIASYFILWPAVMVSSAICCFLRPKERFNPDSFLFRERACEQNGAVYERFFGIRYWKKLLPDGAALFKGGFRKKRLASVSDGYLREFIQETCRAEATHIPPLFLPFVFALYNPPSVVVMMAAFALLTGLPCILAQRYNRIRLRRLLQEKNRRKQGPPDAERA